MIISGMDTNDVVVLLNEYNSIRNSLSRRGFDVKDIADTRNVIQTTDRFYENFKSFSYRQILKLLILHGQNDWRVKVSQAKKLSEKLKEAGKVHELVVFPEGDHGLNSHRAERNRKIFDWFERYLNR
ncbi:MAG TPA: prolyl oligopeptidase family serine peptidase [Desulfatiglandales bacterium]|nr:prolyl oligopeptidase family serine peptidase [Desulfatiglandales bacterium]